MAKLAVLIIAALAFQAALAIKKTKAPKLGEYDDILTQIQTVANDLTLTFENDITNKQMVQTLALQGRQLANYLDTIVNKFQMESKTTVAKKITKGLDELVAELHAILVNLHQALTAIDATTVTHIKTVINSSIQNTIEQFDFFSHVLQKDLDTTTTQGSIHTVFRTVLVDFLTLIQGFQGRDAVDSSELAMRIRDITTGLTTTLQGVYFNPSVKMALREYIKNIETIISKCQREVTMMGTMQMDNTIQELYLRLRQVLVPVMRITEAGITENVEMIKMQFVRELQLVAETMIRLIQTTPMGTQQPFVQEIISEYVAAMEQFTMQVQGRFYENTPYQPQASLFDKTERQGLYDQTGRFDMLFGNTKNQMYGDEGYTGRYKVGMSLMGKETVANYGPMGKGLGIQIQVVINDIVQCLQTIDTENVIVKQTFVRLVREYTHELEMTVDKLQQGGSYESGMNTNTIQEVTQNLNEIVMTLKKMTMDINTVSFQVMKQQFNTQFLRISKEFQQLAMQLTELPTKNMYTIMIKNCIAQFLISSRNFQMQIQNITEVPEHDQAYNEIQIQTIANDLATALETVSVENIQVRDILVLQAREFAQHMEKIIEKLTTTYGIEMRQRQVIQNLKTIVMSLRQAIHVEDLTTAQKLKTQLIECIQDCVAELHKMCITGEKTPMYEIMRDFIAILQHQQIQLQTIYQTSQYGQSTQKLAMQIQAMTNNLLMFFQNAQMKNEATKPHFQMQLRKWTKTMEVIINRLESEIMYEKSNKVVMEVVEHLKQIVMTVRPTTMTTYGMPTEFDVVFQNVSAELKKLAWIAHYDFEQTQGNLNTVVRSVLVQYWVVLQNIQMGFQGINQTVRVGQTPRELALQIEISAHRLAEILRVIVPDNKQTQYSLVWQTRNFAKLIDTIINRLQVVKTTVMDKPDFVQQIMSKLTQIRMTLQQTTATMDVAQIQQLKIQLAMCVEDAAVAIQKLMWVAQEGQIITPIKGILIDFLYGLQNLQMQVQNNLQMVYGGQNPRALTIQIQAVASRLFALFQWMQLQPTTQEIKQTLTIQIGELTQTIENIVQMLHTEMKNTGDDTKVIHTMVGKFSKLSLALQQIVTAGTKMTIPEMCNQLTMHIQAMIAEFQKLALVAQNKIEMTQVDTTNGVLNGVFSNFLATLRNMLIQLHNVDHVGTYKNTQELANQVQIISNKIATTLQHAVSNTKIVKQALAIQVFKYAHRVQEIVEKLENEITYNTEIETLRQVCQNMKHAYLTLQQIATALVTKTTVEIKDQLNTQVQNINAEIQKLLMVQTTMQKQQGAVDTVVKTVLIEYMAAIQHLQIRCQAIFMATEGETIQQVATNIYDLVNDLCIALQRVTPTNKLIPQVLTVETREFIDMLTFIINKLQTETTTYGIVPEVAQQLREIQMNLRRVDAMTNVYQQKMLLEVSVQRATVAIEKLVWAVQPELQSTRKMTTSIETIVREILNQYLVTIQNVHIQIQNVLQNGQVDRYTFGVEGAKPVGSPRGYKTYGPAHQDDTFGYEMDEPMPAPEEYIEDKKYFGGVVVRPTMLLNLIKKFAYDYFTVMNTPTVAENPKAYQIMFYQARKFARFCQIIAENLEHVEDVSEFAEIAETLREVQMSLQKIAINNPFINMGQFKTEFVKCIQTAIAQMEKLTTLVEDGTYGLTYTIVMKDLHIFLRSMYMLNYQLKSVLFHYGFFNYFNKGLGYGIGAEKYDSEYGVEDTEDDYENNAQGAYRYKKNVDYGKFGSMDANKYDEDYYNKLGQTYGKYDTYAKDYKYNDKYDEVFPKTNYYKSADEDLYNQYNKDYTYGQDLPMNYNKQVSQDYEQYAPGYGYGNMVDQYEYQGQNTLLLVKRVHIIVDQIVEQLRTSSVNDKQIRDVLVAHARQLLQWVDNMVDRLQMEYLENPIVRQVLLNLRKVQTDIKMNLNAGVFTTVYQIKYQFANYIQIVAAQLHKLAFVAQTDVQKSQMIKGALVQYLAYLRTFYNQIQYQGADYEQNTPVLVTRLHMVVRDLVSTLRVMPVDTMKVRNIAENIEEMITKIQPLTTTSAEYKYLPTILYKLRQIVNFINEGTGVGQFDVRFTTLVEDICDELKTLVQTVQPTEATYNYVRVPIFRLGDLLKGANVIRATIRGY